MPTPDPRADECSDPERALGGPSVAQSVGLLATRRFGTFWISTLLSNLGTWAQQVAEPWLLLNLSGSSFLVGLDAFAVNAPVLALSLPGGILADTVDRRRVILWLQTLQMLCPAALVALVVTGRVRPWEVVALSLLVGITDALSMPSFQSILPSIVKPAELGSAFALNATQMNLARVLGPVLAGLLLARYGATACFGVNTLSYVPFIFVALYLLPRAALIRPRAGPRRSRLAGYRDILRRSKLKRALLTMLISNLLCGPLVTFIPVLVRRVFHGNASHFGGALAAFGVGGVIGALLLLPAERRAGSGLICTVAALLYAALVMAAGSVGSFSLLVAVLCLAGTAMTMSNVAANTLLQGETVPELRGEAASLFLLVLRGGLSFGNLAAGLMVTALGIQAALLVDGGVALVLLAWLLMSSKSEVVEAGPSGY